MHYRNGREAKQGDKVVNLETGAVGMLHSLTPGADSCNARIAETSASDQWVTVGTCVHLDDVHAAFPAKAPEPAK